MEKLSQGDSAALAAARCGLERCLVGRRWQEIILGLSFQVLVSFRQSISVSNDHPVIFVSVRVEA